jgi:very-short-patch-repair endonuclease
MERLPQDNPRRRKHKHAFARKMRAEPTRAEYKLWWLLRNKAAGGLRFRRQHPIGPYIADFCCPAAKLVIELDGSQHGSDRNAQHDAQRTRWLEKEGYRVLRFDNEGFLSDPHAALEFIWRAVQESGCLRPQGEGK